MTFKITLNKNMASLLNAPYPFDVVDANKKKAIEKHGKDFIIDFGIGDPSDPTPEVIRASVKESVEATQTDGYPVTPGKASFKQAIINYMKTRFNVDLTAAEIVATYGAKHACFQIPQIFTNPGDICLIPNPGYPPYSGGTIFSGATPYFLNILEENNYLPDLQSIPTDVVEKAKILYVNTPHSPTAKVYSKEYLKESVDFCNDNNILLVSDECYADLYYAEKPMSILEIDKADDCSIILHSLSKRSMMSGYAVGFYASKNPDLVKPFDSIMRKSIQGVANIVQDAATTAFTDRTHAEDMRLEYIRRKEVLVPALEAYGMKVANPEGTFFLWAKIPDGENPVGYSGKLLIEKGINCVPGNLISDEFNGVNPGSKHVRFALVPQMEKVTEAAKRLVE